MLCQLKEHTNRQYVKEEISTASEREWQLLPDAKLLTHAEHAVVKS